MENLLNNSLKFFKCLNPLSSSPEAAPPDPRSSALSCLQSSEHALTQLPTAAHNRSSIATGRIDGCAFFCLDFQILSY